MQNAVARARSSITPVLAKAVLTSHFFCKGDKQKTQGCCRYCWLVLAQNTPWPQQRGCRLFKGSCLAPPGAGAGGRCSRKQLHSWGVWGMEEGVLWQRKLLKVAVGGAGRGLSTPRGMFALGACMGMGRGKAIHELREAACSKGLVWLVI